MDNGYATYINHRFLIYSVQLTPKLKSLDCSEAPEVVINLEPDQLGECKTGVAEPSFFGWSRSQSQFSWFTLFQS